ncbi:hypothetical protein HCH_06260 [Hahella chejuensis KCTC 2396]|uniref:Uncharacterized protein n=1 Tax=Hahella chejuensis (strain KCTC 2396) TaxID=349521 RepID=Q2S8W6_HAHCH|nr:hypothetical protein HCH_06260 [Hahella chejuensis KCTC 2396]
MENVGELKPGGTGLIGESVTLRFFWCVGYPGVGGAPTNFYG